MQERPIVAFILSLIGGVFIVLGTAVGFLFYYAMNAPYGYVSGLALAASSIAVSLGFIIVIMATLLYARPELHVAWGVATVVLGAASFITVFSGFAGFGLGLIGMVLGIVGGSVGIAWRPGFGPTATGVETSWTAQRVCLTCGRLSPVGYAFCPSCGTPAPVVGPGPGAPPLR